MGTLVTCSRIVLLSKLFQSLSLSLLGVLVAQRVRSWPNSSIPTLGEIHSTVSLGAAFILLSVIQNGFIYILTYENDVSICTDRLVAYGKNLDRVIDYEETIS